MYNVMFDPCSLAALGWPGSPQFVFKPVLYVFISFAIAFTCNLEQKLCFMYLTLNHWTLGGADLFISALISGDLTQGFT